MINIFIWLVLGIFALPSWAIDHARRPYECEAFHANRYGRDLAIGYCTNRFDTEISEGGKAESWLVEININLQIQDVGGFHYLGSTQ
jgi:hypothetical protein